jgi:hypothetical protein
MFFNIDPQQRQFDPQAVRNYLPAVIPDDKRSIMVDNPEYLKKFVGDTNYMIKQRINNNPFGIKPL